MTVPAADSVLASFPVQQQLGVSLAKMDFLLEIVLICAWKRTCSPSCS
jgi:hypothetical protein